MEKGFTLIELLVVVAIIGIIAAIAIPGLLRARVSANEASMVGDTRNLISAQASYQSANAGYFAGSLSCLAAPSIGCIPLYRADAPPFVDPAMGTGGPRLGYFRRFVSGPGPVPVPAVADPASVTSYVYYGTPLTRSTGVRGIGGDHSGLICTTPDGTSPATGAVLTPGCTPL